MTEKPHNQENDESNRMWATAAFAGVLIVIGLPLWWKTTEVYRVSLPYSEIASFNTKPKFISTELRILADDLRIANAVAGHVKAAYENVDVLNLNIVTGATSEVLKRSLSSDEDSALVTLTEQLEIDHNVFYLVQKNNMDYETWLSDRRLMFFNSEQSSITIVETLNKWVYETGILSGARTARAADSARKTRVTPASSYRIMFTIAHPTPQKIEVDFDTRSAVEDYIGSFVDELSILHNFTLQSQWLHLLNFDFEAKILPSSKEYGVRQDHLHLLLTRVEERAATQVSELATINLLLYVVPCDVAPLVIVGGDGKKIDTPVQAFMSPKWGGVYLASPPSWICDVTDKSKWHPDTRVVMGALIAQLRQLLGIVDKEHIPGSHLVALRSVLPREWEVDSLLRMRTLEQLTSAELTLQSLAQLLGEISNIVINDEVGASINQAVHFIHQSNRLLESGDLLEAYQMSLKAFLEAEAAFTDPSLLALLYFPDDQKYAIYIPLFLPVLFPVVLTLKKLLPWLRGSLPKDKTD